jgi:hypothetical protein
MKHFLLLLAIFFVVTFIYLYLTKYNELYTQENSVLLDVTDSTIPTISVAGLQKLSAVPIQVFSKDEGFGEKTRVSVVNELSRNAYAEAVIKPIELKWFDNEIDRKRNLTIYWHEIDTALQHVSSQKKDRQLTNLYLPVARELNRLSEIEIAQRKKLIIVSDGMISDGQVSFYDPHTLADVKQHPSKYIKLFNDKYPIKSLKGIQVVWVFAPVDVTTSEQFEIVIKFWEQLITEKQGTFTLTTNL